jgi:hypothetical protein
MSSKIVKLIMIPCQMFSDRKGASMNQPCFAAVALICLMGAGCTSSEGAGGGVRSAASTIGWATTVPESKQFVIASRGKAQLDYVPIGRGGVERPTVQRNAAAVKDLESQLDQTRDGSESFARRQLPSGAYGQPLPSVAAPPRPQASVAQQTSGSPESYPVNPNRLRQIRENSRRATGQ